MLQLKNFTLSRGNRTICKNLNVEIESASIIIIEGKNGSGKSSLIGCLIGKRKPTEGAVLLDDRHVHRLGRREKKLFFESTGLVFQESSLKAFDTIAKTLSQNKVSKEATASMLAFLGFEHRSKEMVRNLSYSEQRKLDLGRSLIHQPRLLIWDEPFMGLDYDTRKNFHKALSDLKTSGSTIIICTVNADQFRFLNPEKIIQL